MNKIEPWFSVVQLYLSRTMVDITNVTPMGEKNQNDIPFNSRYKLQVGSLLWVRFWAHDSMPGFVWLESVHTILVSVHLL